VESEYRVAGKGTLRTALPGFAKRYGMRYDTLLYQLHGTDQKISYGNEEGWDRAMAFLKQGYPIIASGKGPAPFTRSGHYVGFRLVIPTVIVVVTVKSYC
jgi:hypothetical protein